MKEEIKDEEKWIIIRRLYKNTHGSTHSGSTVVSLIYKITFLKKKIKTKKNLEYCHLNWKSHFQAFIEWRLNTILWFSKIKIFKTNDHQSEKAF